MSNRNKIETVFLVGRFNQNYKISIYLFIREVFIYLSDGMSSVVGDVNFINILQCRKILIQRKAKKIYIFTVLHN